MAIHGKNARVQKGGTTIAKTSNWTINTSDNLVDIPTHGDNWMYRLSGIRDWNATIELVFDVTMAQQTLTQALLFGTTPATATFKFQLNTAAAASPYYEGKGWLQAVDIGAPAEDNETGTYNIVANGTLTFNDGV
jgi:hypothetical protein